MGVRWRDLVHRISGAPDAIGELRRRVEVFRDLLETNHHVLELMADAGEKLGGEYVFDAAYLRGLDEELAATVETVVRDLEEITGNRYAELRPAFERIVRNVRAARESHRASPDGPLCLDLEDIDATQRPLTGAKMARLGLLRSQLGLPVPAGFVITACAFERLCDGPVIAERREALRAAEEQAAAVRDTGGAPVDGVLEAARQIAEAVADSDLPGPIERALRKAASRFGRGALLAVRSSALGEDGELSFAGQHESVLAVRRKHLSAAYRRVAASLFSERAARYRLERGLPLWDASMAVGVMRMVPAVTSGVLYSIDPAAVERDVMLVHAAPGLGTTVVEGRGATDRFTVGRGAPHPILDRRIAVKFDREVAQAGGGTDLEPLPLERREAAAIEDGQLVALARIARRIERYMRRPQDIEWALDPDGVLQILQARPLRFSRIEPPRPEDLATVLAGYRVLLDGEGEIACRGIGAGPVALVGPGVARDEIPPSSVLVTRNPSPSLSDLAADAAAIVTDLGAATGHLATIAREYRVPTIVGAGVATERLTPGMQVTVDAEENVVYEGLIEPLQRYGLLQPDQYQDRPEFRKLRAMLSHIAPLRLRDPQSPRFVAAGCSTYHDIIRFAHEQALTALSDLGRMRLGSGSGQLVRLDLDIPLDLTLVDLGGGIAEPAPQGSIPRSRLRCAPLESLLEGLTTPGAWATAPAEMDLVGFLSSATRSVSLTAPGVASVERNQAIISRDYLNLSLRLGYHFNVVDSLLGARPDESYVLFRFVGGVTDITRRTRRARLIADILQHFDFSVDQQGDLVLGRLTGVSREVAAERLGMVGKLIGFSRQLDVSLKDDEVTQRLLERFLGGDLDIRPDEHGSEGRVGKQIEVLVLDDEKMVVDRIQDYLVKRGMNVEVFVDSRAAIERLESKRFDVVVTDQKMEGPTGLDVLIHIRSNDLPTEVIIITGHATMESAWSAEVVGVYEYILKPFKLKDIHRLVKKAASRAKRRAR